MLLLAGAGPAACCDVTSTSGTAKHKKVGQEKGQGSHSLPMALSLNAVSIIGQEGCR